MRTASVRDLRYNFPKVERMLDHGETIQITKHKKVVGVLKPARRIKGSQRPPLPDFMARLKRIYGDKVLDVSGAELIRRDRDRY